MKKSTISPFSSVIRQSSRHTKIPVPAWLGRRKYSTNDIPQEFEKYWNLEQDKAFLKLIADENLNKERTQALIEHYIYAEKAPMRDELLDLLEGDKPTLLQRRPIGDLVLKKIVGFVETFINGMVGS